MVKLKKNGGSTASQSFLPFSVEENIQFSLDDEEEAKPTTSDARHGLLNGEPTRIMPNTARTAPPNENHRHPTWRVSDSNKNKASENRDDIRLTDEIELDGDSGSDDLDLLPPLPSKHSTSKIQRRIQKIFVCCPPRFAQPKCTIM
uniref:Uncharacterized protein n=1 Tax=Acrobeloides nanus TaxID=290746 RepID=A0A914CFI4_9BILA